MRGSDRVMSFADPGVKVAKLSTKIPVTEQKEEVVEKDTGPTITWGKKPVKQAKAEKAPSIDALFEAYEGGDSPSQNQEKAPAAQENSQQNQDYDNREDQYNGGYSRGRDYQDGGYQDQYSQDRRGGYRGGRGRDFHDRQPFGDHDSYDNRRGGGGYYHDRDSYDHNNGGSYSRGGSRGFRSRGGRYQTEYDDSYNEPVPPRVFEFGQKQQQQPPPEVIPQSEPEFVEHSQQQAPPARTFEFGRAQPAAQPLPTADSVQNQPNPQQGEDLSQEHTPSGSEQPPQQFGWGKKQEQPKMDQNDSNQNQPGYQKRQGYQQNYQQRQGRGGYGHNNNNYNSNFGNRGGYRGRPRGGYNNFNQREQREEVYETDFVVGKQNDRSGDQIQQQPQQGGRGFVFGKAQPQMPEVQNTEQNYQEPEPEPEKVYVESTPTSGEGKEVHVIEWAPKRAPK